jgi:predicted dehydrogenase
VFKEAFFKMSYTFSIIGCEHAHIGIFIDEMLKAGHRCAGLYEENNDKLANQISAQFGIQRVTNRELLLSDEVKVVGCAAVNDEKIDIIELCESLGKHIMVDKPAVTSRAGLERLQAVMNRGKIEVGMMLTERFRGSLYTLKNQIEQGELGDLVSLTMRKPHRLLPENRPQWHFSKERNGGVVIDLFIHDFDLVRWLTGQEVASAHGVMCKNILPEYPDFYDTAAVQILTDGGIPVQFYADWHNPVKSWTWGDCRLFITGTKGTAELRLEGDPFISTGDSLLIVVTHKEAAHQISFDTPPGNISEDFLSRIEGRPSILTHEDIMATSKAVIESDEQVKLIDRTRS